MSKQLTNMPRHLRGMQQAAAASYCGCSQTKLSLQEIDGVCHLVEMQTNGCDEPTITQMKPLEGQAEVKSADGSVTVTETAPGCYDLSVTFPEIPMDVYVTDVLVQAIPGPDGSTQYQFAAVLNNGTTIPYGPVFDTRAIVKSTDGSVAVTRDASGCFDLSVQHPLITSPDNSVSVQNVGGNWQLSVTHPDDAIQSIVCMSASGQQLAVNVVNGQAVIPYKPLLMRCETSDGDFLEVDYNSVTGQYTIPYKAVAGIDIDGNPIDDLSQKGVICGIVDEDGNEWPTNGNGEVVIPNETLTELEQDPVTGDITYTDENGDVTTAITNWPSELVIDGPSTFTHTSSDGVSTTVDVCDLAEPCAPSIVAGPLPNQYTFNNGHGVTSIIDVNEIDMDISSVGVSGSVVTFTAEDGSNVVVDVCGIVANNCNSTIVVNADGSITHTDNAGAQVTAGPWVQSVTGTAVDNTDPLNPVVNDEWSDPITVPAGGSYPTAPTLPGTCSKVFDENGNFIGTVDSNGPHPLPASPAHTQVVVDDTLDEDDIPSVPVSPPSNKVDGSTHHECYKNGSCYYNCVGGAWVLVDCKVDACTDMLVRLPWGVNGSAYSEFSNPEDGGNTSAGPPHAGVNIDPPPAGETSVYQDYDKGPGTSNATITFPTVQNWKAYQGGNLCFWWANRFNDGTSSQGVRGTPTLAFILRSASGGVLNYSVPIPAGAVSILDAGGWVPLNVPLTAAAFGVSDAAFKAALCDIDLVQIQVENITVGVLDEGTYDASNAEVMALTQLRVKCEGSILPAMPQPLALPKIICWQNLLPGEFPADALVSSPDTLDFLSGSGEVMYQISVQEISNAEVAATNTPPSGIPGSFGVYKSLVMERRTGGEPTIARFCLERKGYALPAGTYRLLIVDVDGAEPDMLMSDFSIMPDSVGWIDNTVLPDISAPVPIPDNGDGSFTPPLNDDISIVVEFTVGECETNSFCFTHQYTGSLNERLQMFLDASVDFGTGCVIEDSEGNKTFYDKTGAIISEPDNWQYGVDCRCPASSDTSVQPV